MSALSLVARCRARRMPLVLGVVATLALQSAGLSLAREPLPEVPPELTMGDVLRLTLAHNPELKALAWERPRAEGRVRQAQLRPNPTLGFELENSADGGAGSSSQERFLYVGQLLELGGKRSTRVDVARADASVIGLDLEARELDVALLAAARYLDLLGLEALERLVSEEAIAASEAVTTTAHRVRSGAAHPVEAGRAEVELASVRLDEAQVASRVALARLRLASLWGDTEARFTRLGGRLEPAPEVADLDSLLAGVEAAPGVLRWTREIAARRKRLAAERSKGVPDIGLVAGLRSSGQGQDQRLLAGVALPLPLFDRNQGATAEALAALDQGADERTNAVLSARREVAQVHGEIRSARRRLDALRLEVLPGAKRAFEGMRDGFERGRFSYLDLLEARRTWLRARREEVGALLDLGLSTLELERLTSPSLDSFKTRIGGQP